jgi:DNA-binding response OmpR family regulator
VLSASTGEEGLDLAMAKHPDLVLLDLLLPRMSGYEVCRRPRASARPTEEVRVGEVTLDLRLRRARCGRRPLDLSSREFELLEYLLDHADRVVTREELLRAVWGYSAAPLTRTVDNFVAKLRKKVERDPRRPRHILTVHGAGYRLVRPSDGDPLPA